MTQTTTQTVLIEIRVDVIELRMINEIVAEKNKLWANQLWTADQFTKIAAQIGFENYVERRHQAICGGEQ